MTVGRHRRRHRDGGDHRAAVRLEDVRAHARHVADVVADVVGDDAGVARIVLGDARFDLADEIRADVRALGEDAAADAGEQRDAGGAHPEAVDGVRGLRIAAEEEVEDAESQQAQGRDRKPHDRAAEEGDGECVGRGGGMRGGGGAHVGPGRGAHADVAGAARAQRPDDEREDGAGAEGEPQHDDDHQAEDGQHLVLAPHEHHGAAVDRLGDLRDLVFPGRELLDLVVDEPGGDKADDAEHGRYESVTAHGNLP